MKLSKIVRGPLDGLSQMSEESSGLKNPLSSSVARSNICPLPALHFGISRQQISACSGRMVLLQSAGSEKYVCDLNEKQICGFGCCPTRN